MLFASTKWTLADARHQARGAPYRDGIVLMAFRDSVPVERQHAILSNLGAREIKRIGVGVHVLAVRPGRVPAAVHSLKTFHEVRYAEPDYFQTMSAGTLPNDTSIGVQWAAQNTGQTVNGTKGTAGADERAALAWGLATGTNSVVVAVLDTGVQYSHPDLFTNMWNNPGGVGGCAAGTHGYNVLASSCDPMDDDTTYGGHGTRVSGIIGAMANNAQGTAGVNWTTSIMALKWVSATNSGATSDLITAMDWVVTAVQAGVNVRVVNDSQTWAGTPFSQALSDEIDALGSNNILFVAASGNTSMNNDTTPRYPCSYARPTMICAAASNQNDALWSSADWGPNSVQLAAPGVNIYSTLRTSNYGYISGGSMAAAQVSGAAALVLSHSNQTVANLRSLILNNVDKLSSLNGLVGTGGRLNICAAISGCTTATSGTLTNSAAPVVTSIAQQGGLLGASTGFWQGVPTRFTYQWDRCGSNGLNCSPIPGATGQNYAPLSSADVQTTLTVTVTASNASSSSSAQSVPSGAVTAASSAFALTPSITDGSTISGTVSWTVTPQQGVQFVQFYIDGTLADTESSSPYTFHANGSAGLNTSGLANGTHVLGARALATDNRTYAFYGETVTVGNAPQNTTLPMISGTAAPGQTLSTTNGVWTNNPTSFTYIWEHCDSSGLNCSNISGAMSSTYPLTASDSGFTIRSSVTASNAYASTMATSTQTAVVSTAATSTSVSSAPNPSTFGQSVTFTATVTSGAGVPTGTMTFAEGATTLASNVTVNASGQASFNTTTLAVGSHTITASFTGTNGWQNSSGNDSAVPQVVQSAGSNATSTSLTSSPNPSTFGQSVTFTATVTSSAGMPNGTVTFAEGATTLASNVAVNGSGQATFSISTLAVGTHTVTASFTGATGWQSSSGNDGATPQVVHGATATTLTSAPNPSTSGQSVTFTATITSNAGVPTGTVKFTQRSKTLASNVAVNSSGQATFSTSTLALGSHTITASFTGTNGWQNSSGNDSANPQVVQSGNSTSTAVTSSPNPSTFGQSVTFTATVTSSAGVPAGSVTFSEGSTTLASNVAIDGSGQATFSTTTLAVGSHTITASFTGATGWVNSSGNDSASPQIVQGATATSISSSPNPSTSGQSVTFTATVTSAAGTPSGTVTFTEGANTLASNVAVNGSGQATFSTTTLAVGSHTITASFTGTNGWQNSSGNDSAAPQVVQAASGNATATTVTSSPNPSTFGQSVTFTATVTSGAGTPSGTVTFTEGASTLASNVAVNGSGQAAFSTTTLAVGSHTITASFTGGTGWQNSNSNDSAAPQAVQGATATSVSSSPNPSTSGQSVTFAATVTSAAGTPTGTVTFTEGATTLASNVAVNGSGQAAFSTTTLAVGSHTITASFTGATGWVNSSGNDSAAPQVVQSSGSGSISFVQSQAVQGTSVASVSAVFPAANTMGNLIIALVRMSTTTQTVTVSDTAGNAYVEAVGQAQTADGSQIHLFYAKNIAGAANTVTATFSAANNHPWLSISEFHGLNTTAPLDQTAKTQGLSASPSSGPTPVTTSANELIFGATGLPATFSGTGTVTAGTGFTMLASDTSGSTGADETETVSSTGAYTATFSLSSSVNWSAIVATFKP